MARHLDIAAGLLLAIAIPASAQVPADAAAARVTPTATIHPARASARPVVYQMERFASASAQQADDREAVRFAVLDYVEGFYEGDTARLMRSVWPDVRKYGYARNASRGTYQGMAMVFPAEFRSYAEDVKAGREKTPANAPKEITLFDVQDQTASAKLTAWWGTDYLLLAKENGRWMITHVLWQTPRPTAPR